jgi:Lon protease-like protein
MFSTLIDRPAPHYYMHVHQPASGSTTSSGDGKKPSGTLMRVVYSRRDPDQRLTLVVQGVARASVTRETQALPYMRADVQILPDAESLLAASISVRRHLRAASEAAAADPSSAAPFPAAASPSVRRRLTMAVAVAEAQACAPYEALTLSAEADGSMAPLCQFNASRAAVDAMTASDPLAGGRNVADAIAAAPMAPAVCYRPVGWRPPPAGVPEGGEKDDLFEGSPLLQMLEDADEGVDCRVSAEAAAAARGESAEAEAEMEAAAEAEATLVQLEIQVWLEIDEMLRAAVEVLVPRRRPQRVCVGLPGNTERAPRRPALPIPSQLVGLLPPTPSAGWPPNFELAAVFRKLHHGFDAQGGARRDWARNDAVCFVPVAAAYPTRRRAERLSYLVWQLLGVEAGTEGGQGGKTGKMGQGVTAGKESSGGHETEVEQETETGAACPLRVALETSSTADRLRLALLRMRAVKYTRRARV